MRVNGVAAGTNVSRGRPKNRTSIGAALVDTASELATGAGTAVTGMTLAALFTGDIVTAHWTSTQTAQFEHATTLACLVLTAVSAALVGFGIVRLRRASRESPTSAKGDTRWGRA